jgi:hypothetical protein
LFTKTFLIKGVITMSQYNQGQNRQDNTRQASSGIPSDRSSQGSSKDQRSNSPQRDLNPNRKEKDDRDKGGKGGRV